MPAASDPETMPDPDRRSIGRLLTSTCLVSASAREPVRYPSRQSEFRCAALNTRRRALRSVIHWLTVPGASGGNASEPATAPQLVWPQRMTCFT